MKIPDRSFLRFAGAEPARQMRKEQRLAQAAHVSGLTYEKPLDSPDRPSNIERKAMESLSSLPDADNPSKILSGISEFRKPVAEGEEEAVVKDSPDNPSTILKSIGELKPPPETPPPLSALDDPNAITRALGEFKPPEPDAAPLAPEVDTPSKILASLMEKRPEEFRGEAIEADSPTAILSSLGQQRAKEELILAPDADLPASILAPIGKPAPEPIQGPGPTLSDLPFDQRPAPLTPGDIPADMRAGNVPESNGGRIVSGEA